ncbi:MAG: dCMP deaminase family protein, partial [Candidatus Omnitrophica bacterium]|nr:dCMP deaminase family protein [Candidatus Omnitrophota bacterium]
YFLKMAYLVAERSTCLRHHVGAVIVRKKHILTTGYNGAASGVKDCLKLGCLRNERGIKSGERHEICRAIHAEQNAIIQAGLHGIDVSGSTIYCTHSPCILCAKMIANAKIKKFITSGKYSDESFKALFKEVGIDYNIIYSPRLTIKHLD